MNATLRIVHKEWREQRATLAIALALGFALALGIGIFSTAGALAEPNVFLLVSTLPLLVCLLTVGGELLGGAEGSTAITFLERLPKGLGQAFVGKLVFLALLLPALAFAGLASTLVAALVGGHGLPSYEGHSTFWLEWSLPLLVLSLWCFAVSPWVPRGPVALPLAAFVLVLFAWPISFLYMELPWYELERGQLVLLAAVGVLAPFGVAASGYLHGRRFGGSTSRAMRLGLGVSALACVPSWSWAALDLRDVFDLDPSVDDLFVDHFVAEESSPYVFLNITQDVGGSSCTHVIAIDPRTSEWWPVGSPGLSVDSFDDPDDGETRFYLHTGRREGPLYEVDPVNRAVTPCPPPLDARSSGYGRRTARRGKSGWYDPFRDRFFPADEIWRDRAFLVLIAEPAWLARDSTGFYRFDPELGELELLSWPEGYYATLVGRDTIVFNGVDGSEYVGSLADGSYRPLTADVEIGMLLRSGRRTAIPEGVPPLFWAEGNAFFLDAEAAHLQRLPLDDVRFLKPFPGEPNAALVITGNELLRVDLDIFESEVIFP